MQTETMQKGNVKAGIPTVAKKFRSDKNTNTVMTEANDATAALRQCSETKTHDSAGIASAALNPSTPLHTQKISHTTGKMISAQQQNRTVYPRIRVDERAIDAQRKARQIGNERAEYGAEGCEGRAPRQAANDKPACDEIVGEPHLAHSTHSASEKLSPVEIARHLFAKSKTCSRRNSRKG